MKQLPEGSNFALYNGGAWNKLLDPDTKKLIENHQPAVIMPHGGPRSILGVDPENDDTKDAHSLIYYLRELSPRSTICLGVGLDGWTKGIATQSNALKQFEVLLDQLLDFMELHVIEHVMWDHETEAKVYPEVGVELATMCLEKTRKRGIWQGITTFDSPARVDQYHWGGHSAFCWSTWCGENGADAYYPQVYVAPKVGKAAPNALSDRLHKARLSWALAETRNWFRKDLVIEPYFQLHNTPFEQIVNVAAEFQRHALWAGPYKSLMDLDGAYALQALCKLKQLDKLKPGGLAEWQKENNLPVGSINKTQLTTLFSK
jgi:hypothetical protein